MGRKGDPSAAKTVSYRGKAFTPRQTDLAASQITHSADPKLDPFSLLQGASVVQPVSAPKHLADRGSNKGSEAW